MNRNSPVFIKRLRDTLLLLILVWAALPALVQAAPTVVDREGYSNGTPLIVHTTDVFNSDSASTLVVFVSTHPSWNGSPVSISSVTDNMGNTWNELVAPTTWAGGAATLLSAMYYVNAPVTSAGHTVTATLTNGAPLVMHVAAISGSDLANPPIVSAITDPGSGTSSNVVSQAITVPADTLLLAWAKNESIATATALDSWALDPASTSFLWAESQTALSAGAYTGHFSYSSSIGWQTAIVGIRSGPPGPVAHDQAVVTDQDTPVNITLTAESPNNSSLTYTVLSQPAHGTLSGVAPDLTYTPNSGYFGNDLFTFKANDGTADSNVAIVSITVRPASIPGPSVVSRTGYSNGNAVKAHTTEGFNSIGASTLIAFVSTHPSWNGLPVSINTPTDNVGNTWNQLAPPTTWPGGAFTLLSSIYYVNVPATSAVHTVTVTLTNDAPLVMHIFAVSGSDVGSLPIVSAITDPGSGSSSNVVSQPITVPANTLLLAWAKNETSATATALDGFTLDPASTSFLWAEYQTVFSAGGYSGHFLYSNSIGWQTAVVGVKDASTTTGPPAPTITSSPANPMNQTDASFSFTDAQAGVSFLCQLDGGGFSGCSSPASYSGLSQGSHTFSVKAQDAGGNQSGPATFVWTVDTTAPPAPSITSMPVDPTKQTSASFSFSDAEAGVTFRCQLDGGAFSACASPTTYSTLSQASHTFAVKAQDAAGNQSGVATFTWTVDTTAPPKPVITSTPSDPTNQTSATFSFTDTEAGVTFLCQLDGSAAAACSSPVTYPGPLTQGGHTFSVRATDAVGNPSGIATYKWRITVTAPPAPVITSAPANPTNQTTATFTFTDSQAGVTFVCQLDGSTFSDCSSSTTYSGLTVGGHTFAVKARDGAGNLSSATSFAWTIDTTIPPPTITLKPANLTNQTSATFGFTDPDPGVTFLCQLDGSVFSACSSPATYGPLAPGNHVFSVRAQDARSNESTATTVSWTIDITPPPTPTITSAPSNPRQNKATFQFTDSEAGVTFLCQLDDGSFAFCSSPKTYSGLSGGPHTFSIKAQDAAGNQSGTASFTWTIR